MPSPSAHHHYDDEALLFGANGEITTRDVLRALAWAAPLRTDQLRRMIAPRMTQSNFAERIMRPLVADGLVVGRYHYERKLVAGKGLMPYRRGLVWALTTQGFRAIRDDDTAPDAPALLRGGAVLGHDLMIGEVVTRIIEWTRPILSSIYLEHENRLDETRRRPIADAMLVLRFDPTLVIPGVIPWQSTPAQPGAGVRFYAIEIDRGTEDYGITDEKAHNYRSVRKDPTFYARYHSMFPVILITVPTDSRKQRWHAGWKTRWPDGHWLIATEPEVGRDAWFEYRQGAERIRSFVDNWQPGQQQLPPQLKADGSAGSGSHAGAAPGKPHVMSLDWVFDAATPPP